MHNKFTATNEPNNGEYQMVKQTLKPAKAPSKVSNPPKALAGANALAAAKSAKPAKATAPKLPVSVNGFALEKGIPVPPPTNGGSAMYPFNAMEIGSSFLIPVEAPASIKDPAEREASFKEEARTVSNRVSGAIRRFAKKNPGLKFAQRTVDDDEAGRGVRVWRVADEGSGSSSS